jgi:hypothetical protein
MQWARIDRIKILSARIENFNVIRREDKSISCCFTHKSSSFFKECNGRQARVPVADGK